LRFTKQFMTWLLIFLFTCQPVLAATQVEADTSVASNKQPQIYITPNNIPMVQIVAPNGAGVSHNLYKNFQVGSEGLLINNSFVIVNTQLAGYIPGNPSLSGGSARIILNEVTGALPSNLNGYMEIAGQKADFILANPNGIIGDNFGFINSSRAVLTTGTPVLGANGSLEAFRVTGGQISIQGKGLDASNVDQVDLISRAITVNAGIWGNQLNVVTGTNQVDYTTLSTTQINGDASVPQVALDVGQLGGMYAKKIYLIGTEKGLGINYQGLMYSTGDVNVTNEGKIIFSNQVNAGGNLSITGKDDVTNQGTMYAQGNNNINTTGALLNTGTVASGQNTVITAKNISSTGIVGSGIKSDGTLGTVGDLTINATGDVNVTGQNLVGGNLTVSANSLTLSNSKSIVGGDAILAATNSNVDQSNTQMQIAGKLIVQTPGIINMDNSVIQAGAVTLNGGSISNRGGKLTQSGGLDTLITATNGIDNTNGTISTNATNLQLKASTINNSQGQIVHAGSGTLSMQTIGDIVNVGGTVSTNGQQQITAQSLDSTQGSIVAQKEININVQGNFTNQQGNLVGSDAVTIQFQGNANNEQGNMEANQGLILTGQSLNNQNGRVANISTSDLNIAITNDIQNQSGVIGGNGNVKITSPNVANQNGQIVSNGNLTIAAVQGVDNANGKLSAQQDVLINKDVVDLSVANLNNTNGSVQGGNNITIKAATLTNSGGMLSATNDINLNSQTFSGGKTNAGRDLTVNVNGDITNVAGGELNTNRNLTLTAGGQINNLGSIAAVQNASLSGSNIINDTGATTVANGSLSLVATGVAGGIINNGQLTGSAVTISGQTMSNTGVVVADALTVGTNTISNAAGARMNSNGDINLGTAQTPVGSITNQGTMYAQGNTNMNSTDTLTNTGTIASAQNTNIAVQQVVSGGTLGAGINNDGSLGTAGDLTLIATGTITATGQNLAGGNLTVTGTSINHSGATTSTHGAATITATAGDIDNTGAVLQASGAVKLSATGTLKNDSSPSGAAGQIIGDSITITASDISNKGGSIQQTGVADTIVTATNTLDNTGGTIAINGSSLSIQANTITNSQGKILHAGAGLLNFLPNSDVNNTGGQITTNGQMQINTGTISNQGGLISAQQQALMQSQQNIDNSNNGTIYVGGNLTATAQQDIINDGGKMQADNGLTLNGQNITNVGGTLINTGSNAALNVNAVQNLNNQNGYIGSNGQLVIAAGSVNNLNNHMVAQGDFSLTVNGDYTNQGTLESSGTISLNAANLSNASTGTITGNSVNLTASGNLTNDGTIQGSQITTNSINMTNNGSIIGQTVTVNATNLTNQGSGAVIGATDTENLWVSNTLTNTNNANIISLGNLNIAANNLCDTNGMFVNRTQQVNNIGSTIEADGNMNLAAEIVTNTSSGVPAIGTTTTTSTTVLTMAPHVVCAIDQNGGYVQSQFGGPGQWGNDLNGYYIKLSLTVPKSNVISYDASQNKIMYTDVTNASEMIITGPDVGALMTEAQIQTFFKTLGTSTYNLGHGDDETITYTRNPANYQISPAIYQGTSNRGENFGYVGVTTWAGKEAGQTTAYCQSVAINANGDYVISFYPGYDPNVNLSPENTRTMPTFHSGASAEETRTTTTNTQTEYIISAPTAGKISVGQNMGLNVGQQFTNQYSQVVVGNAVGGNIGTLQNQGYSLTQTSTSTDQSYFHDWFVTGGGWDGPELQDSSGTQTFGPYTSTSYVPGGIPATFTAKTISVTGTNIFNIQQPPDGSTATTIGSTLVAPSGVSISISGTKQSAVAATTAGDLTSKNVAVSNVGSPAISQAQVTTSTSPTGTALTASQNQTVDFSVSTNQFMLAIPKSGLYQTQPAPNAKYVVETNPLFANYKNFISSDYMMSNLNIDPATEQKRLGDAYYEQQLVNDQINQLTGRQYLSGYSDTNSEYKALMDNGIAASKTLNLVPGIALTAEQISKLSSDLVWMVQKDVTLPSGEVQQVLVPEVYIAPANTMILTAGGALIAADKVDINVTGKVENTGTIQGDSSLSVQGTDIVNSNSGQITSNGTTYLKATNDILNQSAIISGKQVIAYAGNDIKNETTTSQITSSTKNGGYSWTGSNTLVGTQAGIVSQDDLTVSAGRDISILGGNLTATGNTLVSAGGNLTVGVVTGSSSGVDKGSGFDYSQSQTTNITSAITGNNVTLLSQGDVHLTGTKITATNDITLGVQGNLTLDAVKDANSASATVKNYHSSTSDETTVGTNLQAGNNITITAGTSSTVNGNNNQGNIILAGSTINSTNGDINITATQGVTIQEVTEKHESLVIAHNESSSGLSTTSTDTMDHTLINKVVGSTISGDKVSVSAGTDLNIQGSNIVGTNDVTLSATNNVNITSAKETGKDEHDSSTQTSGVFTGGGLGITIGSNSEKTTTTDKTLDEIGSTVGSTNGNVTVTAGNQVASAGTTFVTGKDLTITGKDVTIDNTINTVDSQTEYESKQSGLTVSLDGGAVTAGTAVAGDIKRSSQVEDDRLKALYDYKATQDIKKLGDSKGNLTANVGVNVSIGSSQMTSDQTSHTETVNTSNINSGGNANITATAGDVNLTGTNINATDIMLDAKNNINIDSGENKQQTTTTTSSSSWSAGGTIGTGFSGSYSKGSGNENENVTTNAGSIINATSTLMVKSGNDTDITGSKVKGDKVVANIGGDLHIASVQDTDNYTANNQSIGAGVSIGQVDGKPLPSGVAGPINKVANGGLTGSFNQGKTDSNYASVTDQAGIFAGDGGFNITVGKNTDLKGAVIASTANSSLNNLSTNNLTFSNITNNANYSSSSIGANLGFGKDKNGNGNALNQQGFTPNIGVPASGNASSTTQSAVSAGTINIRSGQSVDLNNLSRNTTASINALAKIFNQTTVQEQQQLAQVFGQEAFTLVGDISQQQHDAAITKAATDYNAGNMPAYQADMQNANEWAVGGSNEILLHTVVGGITSSFGGSSFVSGAVGAGAGEAASKALSGLSPDMQQWASAIIGAAASKAAGGNVQTGASTSSAGTKYNDVMHLEQEMVVVAGVAITGYVAIQEGEKVLLDKAGNVIAKWASDTGTWISNTYAKYQFEKAVENGEPTDNHSTSDGSSLPATGGEPNSSVDLLNPDGTVKQRRYYGPDGRAVEDIDYNHSDDGTHTFPHRHTWDWSQPNPRQ